MQNLQSQEWGVEFWGRGSYKLTQSDSGQSTGKIEIFGQKLIIGSNKFSFSLVFVRYIKIKAYIANIGVNATGDTSPVIFVQPGTKYLISPSKFVKFLPSRAKNYTVSQINDTALACSNFNIHQPILIIFGRNAA